MFFISIFELFTDLIFALISHFRDAIRAIHQNMCLWVNEAGSLDLDGWKGKVERLKEKL